LLNLIDRSQKLILNFKQIFSEFLLFDEILENWDIQSNKGFNTIETLLLSRRMSVTIVGHSITRLNWLKKGIYSQMTFITIANLIWNKIYNETVE